LGLRSKVRLGNPVPTAKISRFRSRLLLLQHGNDLLFRKSLLLYKSVLNGADSKSWLGKSAQRG